MNLKFKSFLISIQKAHRLFIKKTSIFDQKGQGMIEYLLILVLSIALVMALSKGLGGPLQDWVKNNVTKVAGCMLRRGELPSKAKGICSFDASLGIDLNASAGGAGSSGGSGNGSSSNASKTNSSDSSNTSKGSENSNDRDGSNNEGSAESPSSQSRSGSSSPRVRSSSSGGSINESGFGDNTTRIKIKPKKSDSSSFSNEGGRSTYSDGENVMIITTIDEGQVSGRFSVSKEAEKKLAEKNSSAAGVTERREASPFDITREDSNSRFAIPKEKKRDVASKKNTEEGGFSFMKMVKWIIILGILFIFLVISGTQLNAIRKGMD